jgi:gas vesicle protein
MNDTASDKAAYFLLGAALGATAALLLAPEKGEKTRRKLVRKGDEVADYLMGAGKDLVDTCEDLYERSAELAGEATRELSGKYRALHDQSKELLEETEAILRRAKKAARG